MKYLNQLEYPNLPYPTDTRAPDSPMRQASIKEAGGRPVLGARRAST